MKHSTKVGKFTMVPEGLDTEFFFELESGEFLALKFIGGLAEALLVPTNTKIALCMSENKVNGYHLVCTHTPFFRELKDG